MATPSDITLFIDPFTHHFLSDALFDPKKDTFGGDDILAPWRYLRDWFRQRGVQVYTADRFLRGEQRNKNNIYMSFGIQKNCRALSQNSDVTLSAYFAFESPVVEPTLYENLSWVQRCFKRIYTFADSESLQPFLRSSLESQLFCLPYPYDGVNEQVWNNSDRKFMGMINTNRLPRLYWNELYTERLRALEFFSRTGEVDLYGVGWADPPYRSGKTRMPYTFQRIHRRFLREWDRIHPDPLLRVARRVWRGPVKSKASVLGQYIFSICFDNTILNGWITEKIFDCFYAGTIPIYWGAPDIEKYIPKECFIDMRQFRDYAELRDHLKSMTPAEIHQYKDCARDFFASDKFKPFSKANFTERCGAIIQEDTGISLD